MRISLQIILILILQIEVHAQFQIQDTELKISIPEKWTHAGDQENEQLKMSSFKRDPIQDSEGRGIIANIALISEANQGMDVVTYSAVKRGEMPNFDVLEVFIPKDWKMKYKNGIGYKGKYTDVNGEHTVYVMFFVNGDKGVRIICDSTTEVFNKIEQELISILKTVNLR